MRVGIILLAIFIFNVSAQEITVEQNNTRVSIYLHPASLIYFGAMNYLGVFDGIVPLYSTIEIPFSLHSSLIIRPSFLSFKLNSADGLKDDVFRLGSDFGFRYHLSGKGEGFYLQGLLGVFYNNSIHIDDETDVVIALFPYVTWKLWLDAYIYIGHSLKFSNVSVFVDAGIGFVPDKRFPLWPDLNLGIGIPFGTAKPISENEQEEWAPKDSNRATVYLHPVSFLYGIYQYEEKLLLYSTIEIPFSSRRSLIIKPSFIKEFQNRQGYTRTGNGFKAGSDIGMRNHYSKSFYWQVQTGVFYYDADYAQYSLFPDITANNAIWLDIMAYSGYSKKFSKVSVFADIGIGLASWFGLKKCEDGCSGFFPWVDANFGVGIPF